MVGAIRRRRGYDAGSGGARVAQKDVTDYAGETPRSEEACRKAKVEKQYPNRYVWYNTRGDWQYRTMDTESSDAGDTEWGTWSGGLHYENNRGDQSDHCTGCKVDVVKKGEVGTTQGPSDVAKYNGCRSCSGNDGNQKQLAIGGAKYQESFGYDAHYQAMYTQAYAGNATENALGKKTINAEKGVGIGVNQGSNKQVYTRWEPDGTFHLQVKPAGPDGAVAYVKVTPDGAVKIITEGAITMEAAKSMTIKTPTLNIKGDIKHQGNMTTEGRHTDDNGVHTKCPC